MRKIHVVLLAMALILGSMGMVQAFSGDLGEIGGKHGRGPGLTRMLDRLDLSDEQGVQVAAILKRHRAEIGDVAKEMMDARVALVAAASAKPRSQESVKAAAERIADVHVRALLLRSTIMSEVESVLTPEQSQEIESFRSRLLTRLDRGTDHWLSVLDDWIVDHEE